jgi:predicted nucleic acid-binding Zn ribbon protein
MNPTTQVRHRSQPALLSQPLGELMASRPTGLSQRYEAANQICLLWAQLLPPELAQHCRVIDLSGGVLTVEADSPSYMYELRISSHQLVGHLHQGCPAAKVRAIKITLAQ